MRRGGGSRGSRSSGGRGSSRMSSSSRRHYGRHGGYYGGGYYGRRRGYGYGYFNPIGIIIFIFFIGLIIVAAIASAIGGSSVISDDLYPGEMMKIDSDSFVSATMQGGTVVTHFFKSHPQVLGSISYTFSDSKSIQNDGEYVYWEDYYASGSIVELTWSSIGDIDFFVIIGKSNFDKWEDGEITQNHQESGIFGTYTYTATSDTNVYFAFENSSFNSKTVTVDFQIQVPTYDTSTADKSISGSFSDQDIDHQFAVVENIGSSIAVFTLELNKQFDFMTVFLIGMVLYIALLYFIGKKLFGKKDKSLMSNRSTRPMTQSQLHQSNIDYSTPARSNYVQRPQPKYCANCGTSVLSDTQFCQACGTKV